jgi:gliding motility-associated-like protein
MKQLLFVLSFLSISLTHSQFCPYLGPDQYLSCGVNSTTLTADLSQCSPGNNPNQTTSYNVSQIPYAPQANTGIQLFMSDDSQQGPFNIGFNFCFYGNTYTQFWVGSNGWISFSPGQSTTFTSQSIPSLAATVPKNCIMGPWQDWHPGLGGQIRYQTVGTAPCRKLIVSWINVPMFSCTANQGTFHIVIHESTNFIDSYIQNKPACLQWANGTAVHGIHNAPGTAAVAVPGRNSSTWTAFNDAWRWTPTGPTVPPTLTWFQVGNPLAIGTGPTINVTPPPGGAQYTCHFVYPTCNAGWSTCNNIGGFGPDTVLVVPGPPNLSPPAVSLTDPTCAGNCDGEILITPSGGTAPFNIVWVQPIAGLNPNGLCSGTYDYVLTDANGCSINGFGILVDPPIVTVSPISGIDTICIGSNLETYSVISQPGYSYTWQTPGNIMSGQGTNTLTVDWSSFPPGFIPSAVQVVANDSFGCTSAPSVFDIFILEVIPAINQIGPFCSVDACVNLNATPASGTFSGSGVNLSQFCPQTAGLNNEVIYTYTQSGCTFDDTINVIVNPNPEIVEITPSNVFVETCDSASILFTANTLLPLGDVTWTSNNEVITGNPVSFTWDNVGIYLITATHTIGSCVSSPVSTSIVIEECPRNLIFVPNAFTPDGDENNNTWKPIITNGIDQYKYNLIIVDRWGETIFESYNPNVGWDGIHNNLPCPVGVYTYMLSYGLLGKGGYEVLVGHVTLIR